MILMSIGEITSTQARSTSLVKKKKKGEVFTPVITSYIYFVLTDICEARIHLLFVHYLTGASKLTTELYSL